MTAERFIFTCSTGRAGLASLSDALRRAVPTSYVAFEEPQVRPVLPGPLARFERRFRRRFIETHELLGRGRVLDAFAQGDDGYIEAIAARRLTLARRAMRRAGASLYIDVSSHYAKGLHVGFARLLPSFSLIRLVRDPLLTMRSYLNRKKNFWLDNPSPGAPRNILRLDPRDLAPGEFYLWIWCEIYLRFEEIRQNPKVECAVELRTEHLASPRHWQTFLDALQLPRADAVETRRLNDNTGLGFGPTQVTAEDVALFRRFVDRLPAPLRDRIAYLRDYDPSQHLRAA